MCQNKMMKEYSEKQLKAITNAELNTLVSNLDSNLYDKIIIEDNIKQTNVLVFKYRVSILERVLKRLNSPTYSPLTKFLEEIKSNHNSGQDYAYISNELNSYKSYIKTEKPDQSKFHVPILFDGDIIINPQKNYIFPDTIQTYTCKKCAGKKYLKCNNSECGGRHKWSCKDCSGKGEIGCETCDKKGALDCTNCKKKGCIDCTKCGKSGYIDCSKCGKTGKLKCSSCSGQGKRQCETCGPSGGKGRIITGRTLDGKTKWDSCRNAWCKNGWKVCQSCNGKKTSTCGKCAGKKKLTCSNCDGEKKITCKKCNGEKKITCKKCNGNKFLTCKKCDGHKTIVCSKCYGDKARYGLIDCEACDTQGGRIEALFVQQKLIESQEIDFIEDNESDSITNVDEDYQSILPKEVLTFKQDDDEIKIDCQDKFISQIRKEIYRSTGCSRDKFPKLLEEYISYMIIPYVEFSYRHILTNSIHKGVVKNIWENPVLELNDDSESLVEPSRGRSFWNALTSFFSKLFKTAKFKEKEDKKMEIKLLIYLAKADGYMDQAEKIYISNEIGELSCFSYKEKMELFELLNMKELPVLTADNIHFFSDEYRISTIQKLEKIAISDGDVDYRETAIIDLVKSRSPNN